MANHQCEGLAHSDVAGRGMSGAARMQYVHKAKCLSHVFRGVASGFGGLVVPLLEPKPNYSPAEKKVCLPPWRWGAAGVNEEESPGKRRDGRTPGKAYSVTLDPTRTLTQMENWWRCLWRLLQSRAHFCFTRGRRRSGTHCREVKRSKGLARRLGINICKQVGRI